MPLQLSVVGAVDNLVVTLTDNTFIDLNGVLGAVGLDLNETISLGFNIDTSGLTSTTVVGSGVGDLLNFDLGESGLVLTPGGLSNGSGLGLVLEGLPGLGDILGDIGPSLPPVPITTPVLVLQVPLPNIVPFSDNTVLTVLNTSVLVNQNNT